MILLVPMLTLFDVATADDGDTLVKQPLYESIADLKIGRVFLDPPVRRLLDQQRASPVVAGISESVSEAPAETSPAEPTSAGYIIRGSGDALRWRDGDFVRDSGLNASSVISFPGDISITRHSGKQPPSARPADDNRRGAGAQAQGNEGHGTQ